MNTSLKSALSQGNKALRDKYYEQAITYYVNALIQTPKLTKIISQNIIFAKQKRQSQHPTKQRVAVCGWELSHNAAGRVYTLAKLYQHFAPVEIIGSLLPKFGSQIWAPIRDIDIPLHSFIVHDENQFVQDALQFVAEHPFDIVHLSKPRLPNIIMGALYKLIWNARVLVDIDDEELAFVKADAAISVDNYLKKYQHLPAFKNLNGPDWTRLAVGLVNEFDGITVSNPALQKRYGGEIIHHARDEKRYFPSVERQHKSRKKFGIPQHKKVVLFFGTPREHKGLLKIANAIAELKSDNVIFVIVGDFPNPELKEKLLAKTDVDYRFIANQPFDSIPEIVSMGDFCILLQDSQSAVSHFQVPAKLSDALGMGLVVLSSLPKEVLEEPIYNAVINVTNDSLGVDLGHIINNDVAIKLLQKGATQVFIDFFSYAKNTVILKKIYANNRLSKHVSTYFFKNLRNDLSKINILINIFDGNLKLIFRDLIYKYNFNDFKINKFVKKDYQIPKSPKKLPLTILIITWDIGHNPLGRSYMLAEAMDRCVRNVVLTGFQFPRYGNDIWEPVRKATFPVISIPGTNFPEILDLFDKIVKKFRPDVVIACKARLPSVQLGIMFKEKYGIPLIIDIDDHELSFCKNSNQISMEQFQHIDQKKILKEVEPYSDIWTRLANDLCKYADDIIVSNVALQQEFGGKIVSHVRNENVFNPSLYNKIKQRKKYNIPITSKVVMFFGTPRHHKGVNTLAEAIGNIKDGSYILVMVGTATDKSVTAKLNQLGKDKIIYLPNQPFSLIPEIIVMADLVCLPQDEGHYISKYQLPAKAIDAIGMGIPLFVSNTKPLMQLVNDGVAKLFDKDNLALTLKRELDKTGISLFEKNKLREIFLEKYSYNSASIILSKIIQNVLVNNLTSLSGFRKFVNYQKNIFSPLENKKLSIATVIDINAVDIVLFWKQNDTNLYGRRSDMVIKYLANRDDVRKVIVFDAPISEWDLLNFRNTSKEVTQDSFIYLKTYEKILGKYDKNKISYNIFTYPPGIYSKDTKGLQLLSNNFINFVSEVLEQECVKPDKCIFWIYPKNFLAPSMIDFFSPSKIVVDVVDDHRAWPGVSEKERQRLTDNYREILARADMAFVNCDPMVDVMKEFYSKIRLVPNGCDSETIKIDPVNNSEFDKFIEWKGKTIGFIGNLEAKIDISLIVKIATCFPDCQIVLIGSTHANPNILQLRKYANVRFPGVVTYDTIGAWISRFDVGIIPHLNLEMTKNMNPLKLYVYLSWHIPVVSTEIYNIDNNAPFLRIGNTHQQFIEHITSTFNNKSIDNIHFQRYIDNNSWSARFKEHVDELIIGLN